MGVMLQTRSVITATRKRPEKMAACRVVKQKINAKSDLGASAKICKMPGHAWGMGNADQYLFKKGSFAAKIGRLVACFALLSSSQSASMRA